ncbi:MAG: heavy-metal-associated domain-containing protein [Cyclobacteriaceae bacterium]
MNTESFEVENLKCQGCANSVKKRLMREHGVSAVDVNLDEGTVKVAITNALERTRIAEVLADLGYPEQGTGNLLQKGKSFVSCAIGRIGNE